MGDDDNGNGKLSKSDASIWDFDGQGTQKFDSQFSDSPTSSPGNKFNGDDADNLHTLHGETQVVNFDAEIEVMDIPDFVKHNGTQLFNDYDTEGVVDRYREETENTEVVDESDEDSGRRASTNSAYLEHAQHMHHCKEDRNELMRKMDCGRSEQHTSGVAFTYIDSPESGDASVATALDFLDNYVKLNTVTDECECDIGNSTGGKETPVLSAKGTQTLAKSATLIDTVGERGVFDWDNNGEDEGGELFRKDKEAFTILGVSRGKKQPNIRELFTLRSHARKDKRKSIAIDVQKVDLEYNKKRDTFRSKYKKTGLLNFPLADAMEIVSVSKRSTFEKTWHDQNKELMEVLKGRTTLMHEIIQAVESSPSPSIQD